MQCGPEVRAYIGNTRQSAADKVGSAAAEGAGGSSVNVLRKRIERNQRHLPQVVCSKA